MDTDTWEKPSQIHAARINGTCLCGVVRWSYDRVATSMLHCHCSICRKHHGTLFATFVSGPLSTFHWRAGTECIGSWQSSPRGRRSFCSRCGSKVPGVNHEANQVWMPAGTLEGEFGIRPQMHLFVGSRVPFHRIDDGLPQYQTYPPEWHAVVVETPPRCSAGGVTGSCACGDLRFELLQRPLRMHHCHCARCRRARGSAHATNVIYGIDALSYTQGESQLVDFDLPGAEFFGASFCASCGGAMPRRSPARGVVVVPIGSLDDDPKTEPLAHQFVASKAAWYEIHDRVPQFAGAAPRTPAGTSG
jgi:hypothetical protein